MKHIISTKQLRFFLEKNKGLLFFMTLILFFGSNVIYFSGDVCVSSPCGDLNINQSERVSDQGTLDYFGSMTSNIVLSPTTIIIKPILGSMGYEFSSDIWWNGSGYFDMSNETFDTVSKNGMLSSQSDSIELRNAYFISKIITLLSLPFWLLYGFVLTSAYKKSKLLGITFGIFLFAIAIFPILAIYIFGQLVTIGSYRYTNQILF
jgi:hypothetical protein